MRYKSFRTFLFELAEAKEKEDEQKTGKPTTDKKEKDKSLFAKLKDEEPSKKEVDKENEKIRKYAEEFVLCKKCGKPDTSLQKENDLVYLKCQACAEKYTVKTKL